MYCQQRDKLQTELHYKITSHYFQLVIRSSKFVFLFWFVFFYSLLLTTCFDPDLTVHITYLGQHPYQSLFLQDLKEKYGSKHLWVLWHAHYRNISQNSTRISISNLPSLLTERVHFPAYTGFRNSNIYISYGLSQIHM